MTPHRVFHLIEGLGPGGAERLLHIYLSHLDPGRFQSTVVTVFANGGTHWVEPIERLGVTVVNLGFQSRRNALRAIADLTRMLRKEGADLLHTHLLWANLIGRPAGRLAGVPVISSIHNTDYEPEVWNDYPNSNAVKMGAVRALDAWTARLACRRIIAVSDYVRQSAHRHLGVPLGRMDVLYNPVDVPDLLAPEHRSRYALLHELGLPSEARVLLNVGRVAPQKGLVYGVRALPAILERDGDVHLVSVGSTVHAPYVEEVLAEAKRLGVTDHVHLLGTRRDVTDLLHACDLFLFPSLYEGLPLALVEAMVAGKACISTNVGAMPEVIRHGVDGWLVAPGDPAALAEAACRLLDDSDLRGALGRAAVNSALAKFQPKPAADRLAGLYESVLDDRVPTGPRRRQCSESVLR